jgi:hypothetical protein
MSEFPQVYINEDGVELVASNEVQAAAYENNGFKVKAKGKQPKSE